VLIAVPIAGTIKGTIEAVRSPKQHFVPETGVGAQESRGRGEIAKVNATKEAVWILDSVLVANSIIQNRLEEFKMRQINFLIILSFV
jgi:hypothetical protein